MSVSLGSAEIALRVFVSSPGDVSEERVVTQRVVERINARFAPHVRLSAILWEHEPLPASITPQSGVPDPAECDFVVCILWSRLGTRLPPEVTRRDGSRYGSGTEYEFERAIGAWTERGRPHLLVYRKTTEATVSLSDAELARQALTQKEDLDRFFTKWFANNDGSIPRAYHDFMEIADFEDRLEAHLSKLVEQEAQIAGFGPGNSALWKGTPFRGLEPFEAEHAPVFFGRRRQVSEVLALIRRRDLVGAGAVCLVGPSGSGKSSCARAGVLPMIVERGVMPRADNWRVSVVNPGPRPMSSLSAALMSSLGPDSMIEGATASAMVDRVEDALRSAEPNGETHLVLLVDQLEELFTQIAPEASERVAFLEAVEALATSSRIWLIFTLRSDFTDQMQREPALVRLFEEQGLYHFGFPQLREFSELIRKPVQAAGLQFERDANADFGLDDVILRHAATEGNTLPLVQFCLSELFNRCEENGVLTFSAYEESGGIAGALGERAEKCFQAMGSLSQQQFDNVFRGLIEVSEDVGSKPAKKTADKNILTSDPAGADFVERFLSARLFVAEHSSSGGASIKIAHEALLNAWPRLSSWIQNNRTVLIAKRRVERAAGIWSSSDCDPALLLPAGRPLREAIELENTFSQALTSNTIDFISASRDRDRMRVSQRRFAAAAFVSLGVLVLAGSLLWGIRETAQSLRLDASNKQLLVEQSLSAQRLRDLLTSEARKRNSHGDIQAAGLLLDAALTTESGNPSFTQRYLLAELENRLSVVTSRIRQHSENVVVSTNLGDGRDYLTGDAQGVVRVWDEADSVLLASWAAHEVPISSLVTTLDGRHVLSAGLDGIARVRNINKPESDAAVFQGHVGPIMSAAAGLERNEEPYFATAGIDRTFRTWRIGSNASTYTTTLPFIPSNGIGFSDDMETFAIGGRSGDIAVISPRTDTLSKISLNGGSVDEILFGKSKNWIAARNAEGVAGLWLRSANGDLKAHSKRTGVVRLQHSSEPDHMWVIFRNGAAHLISLQDDLTSLVVPKNSTELTDGIVIGERCLLGLDADGYVYVRSLAGENFARFATGAEPTSRFNPRTDTNVVRLTAPSGETLSFQPHCSDVQRYPASNDRTMAISNVARLVGFGDDDGKVQLIDLDTLDVRFTLDHSQLGWVNNLDFSDDGKFLTSVGSELVVWSTDTGKEIFRNRPSGRDKYHLAAFDQVGLTALRSQIDSNSYGNHNRMLIERRVAPFFDKVETTKRIGAKDAFQLAHVPGYSAIVLHTSRRVQSTYLPEFGVAANQHTDSPTAMAIASSGGRIAVGGGSGDIHLMRWTQNKKTSMRSWSAGEHAIRFLAITATGERIVAADANGKILFLDATSGEELLAETSSPSMAGPLIFCCDGAGIVVGGADGKVRLYNFDTGEMISVLANVGAPVLNIAFDVVSKLVIVQTASSRNFISLPIGSIDRPRLGAVADFVAKKIPLHSRTLEDSLIRLAMANTPILSDNLTRQSGPLAAQGTQAAREGRFADAINLFNQETQLTPADRVLNDLLSNELSGRTAIVQANVGDIADTLIGGGIVVASGWTGELAAIDAKSGAEIARHSFDGHAVLKHVFHDMPLVAFNLISEDTDAQPAGLFWNFATGLVSEPSESAITKISQDGARIALRTLAPASSRITNVLTVDEEGLLGDQVFKRETELGASFHYGELIHNIVVVSPSKADFEVWSTLSDVNEPVLTGASLASDFGIGAESPITSVAVSDITNRIAAVTGGNGIVFDASSGKGHLVASDILQVRSCSWRDGGTAFALIAPDRVISVDLDGGIRSEVRREGRSLWTCGPEWIALRDTHQISFYDSENGRLIKRVTGIHRNMTGPDIDVSDGLVAYGDSMGTVHVFDPMTLVQTGPVWTTDWPILKAEFCSDGRRVFGIGRNQAIQVDLDYPKTISENRDLPTVFDAACLANNRIAVATSDGLHVFPKESSLQSVLLTKDEEKSANNAIETAADAKSFSDFTYEEKGKQESDETRRGLIGNSWSAASFITLNGINVLVAITPENALICLEITWAAMNDASVCPEANLPAEAEPARPLISVRDDAGEDLVLIVGENGVYLANIGTGALTFVREGRGAETTATYLPTTKSSQLVSYEPGDRTVLARNFSHPNDLQELFGAAEAIASAISLEGQSILGLEASGGVIEWNTNTADFLRYETPSIATGSSAILLEDGEVLAVGDRAGGLSLYDRLTRKHLARLQIHGTPVLGLASHPSRAGILSFSENEISFRPLPDQAKGFRWWWELLVILCAALSAVAFAITRRKTSGLGSGS